jgi:hypothetical protein
MGEETWEKKKKYRSRFATEIDLVLPSFSHSHVPLYHVASIQSSQNKTYSTSLACEREQK